MPYQLPSSAKPFTLSISDSDLDDFKTLLKLSKLGPLTYENQQSDRRYGITQEWLSTAKEHWLTKYDWRAQEAHINSFDNYTLSIEDLSIHFIGLWSDKHDAIPLIFMHGWPGSFIEFLPILGMLRERYPEGKGMPYHVVVPSLPGYTLSEGGPKDKDWTMEDAARVMDTLMKELGFEKYIAQGGDVGSFIAHILALTSDSCVGVHLNMLRLPNPPPDFSKFSGDDQAALGRAYTWLKTGSGYALEHGTRPSTIGHVLSSSPLALLAWIGEKFLEWTDTDPALDTILTNVTLYWFTQSFPRSIYPYRSLFGGGQSKDGYIKKPLGFSYFPKELMPGLEKLVEEAGELVSYKKHEHGGHFAALEHPEELLEDVEEFVGKAWKV